MIDVEVGPGAGSRRLQLHLQAGRSITATTRLDTDLADRIAFTGRKGFPTVGERRVPCFKVSVFNQFLTGGQVHDAQVIQVDRAGHLSKPEVHGGCVKFFFGWRELEAHLRGRFGDRYRLGSRQAKEHPGPHRLAIDQQSRRAGAGVDTHGFRALQKTACVESTRQHEEKEEEGASHGEFSPIAR